MLLLAYADVAAAEAAANHLRSLGAQARKLLEQCVENQGVTRKKASRAANQLQDAGYVFLTESVDLWCPEWSIRPALAGEEALEMLEQLEATTNLSRKNDA
jgi:hypothetical protein